MERAAGPSAEATNGRELEGVSEEHDEGQNRASARVEQAVTKLKQLLAEASTENIVGHCVKDNILAANFLKSKHGLHSPERQQAFLLSVLLASPPPADGRPLTENQWKELYACLEEAFAAYLELFWPSPEELRDQSDEWHAIRSVAMPAFIHYFNTGLLATAEQVRSRITRYVAPFDDWFEGQAGLSVSKALIIADWLHTCFSDASEELKKYNDEVTDLQAEAAKLAKDRGLPDTEVVRIAVEELGGRPSLEGLHRAMTSFAAVSPQQLVGRFVDSGAEYLREFVGVRGNLPDIDYPTESYSWDALALVRTAEERLLIPSVNGLYTSILEWAERLLKGSDIRDDYFRHRDKVLEEEVVRIFRRLLPEADYYQNLCETTDGQYEHDLIILVEETVILIEAKAAPPIEPFRDPERAFTRLRHGFRNSSGIQHGFEQAARIRRRLENGEVVELFDLVGGRRITLDPSVLTEPLCVCVTRDNFGPLATDLALLLERQPEEAYPWVVNVFDLDAIAEAWEYLGWGSGDLLSFLEWRLKCHGKVFGTDELEYIGYHIRHGSLRSVVESDADFMQLNHHYSDFFDELYTHVHFGGPAPETDVIEPVLMDLGESLKTGRPVFVESQEKSGGAPEES